MCRTLPQACNGGATGSMVHRCGDEGAEAGARAYLAQHGLEQLPRQIKLSHFQRPSRRTVCTLGALIRCAAPPVYLPHAPGKSTNGHYSDTRHQPQKRKKVLC
jgi:hypothetical protein